MDINKPITRAEAILSGEATISIEGQMPKPKVKWENKGGGTLYLTVDDNDTLNASYNDIMDAIDNGQSVCIKSLVDDIMDCSYLISTTSNDDGHKPYVVTFANVIITNNVPTLGIVSYAAASPREKLEFSAK